MNELPEIPQHINAELRMWKGHFPFRIVWVAHRDGEWLTGCNKNRSVVNRLVRDGWVVATVT